MVKVKKEKNTVRKQTAARKKTVLKTGKQQVAKRSSSRAAVKAAKVKKPSLKITKKKPEILTTETVSAVNPKETVIAQPAEPLHRREPVLPVKEQPKPAPEVLPAAVKEPSRQVHKAAVITPEAAVKKEAPVPVKEIPKPITEKKPHKEAAARQEAQVATAVATSAPEVKLKVLELELPITVKDLAIRLQEKPSLLIKTLMEMGSMIGINAVLDESLATKVCQRYGYAIAKAPGQEEIALRIHTEPDNAASLRPRAPIVTFMGHVDHGKTSLLDAIRNTKVAESEHGGITQHIGAYRVKLPAGEITFLDTPGHEAFTAMRSRGASITDIVVLVVAADDGVMPQTQEAIDHARAAGVPIIVALNKVDKPQANIDRVKKQLGELNLLAEDWGGKTITVPVSAKTGSGIDNLLEMILLEAQMLELKANPNRPAKGIIIEAKMSKGRGPVATLLVQNGTLHLNENIIVGSLYGKVRAMFDDHGRAVTSAGPSFPVEVLGLSGVPQAGEQFFVIADEREAKALASLRQEKERQQQIKTARRVSLEDLHLQIQEGKLKELKLIVKADVQGSLEAIKDTLGKLNVSEIKLDIIHLGVGSINTSDVVLAMASNALILGFNVDADERARDLASREGVEIQIYNIIYELANEIKLAIEGMLEPKLKKVFQGRAEVRKVFKLSRAGTIAGCFVTKGKIMRQALANVVRNGEVVFEGKISSLKRFKDDVRDVAEGFECGIALAGFDDYREADVIETFEIEKIARKLE